MIIKTKWVVEFSAEDGNYEKLFDTRAEAIAYVEYQIGHKVENTTGKIGTIVDQWGRQFSMGEVAVGTCEFCKDENRAITKVSDATHSKPATTVVALCSECACGVEYGTLEIKDGTVQYTAEFLAEEARFKQMFEAE